MSECIKTPYCPENSPYIMVNYSYSSMGGMEMFVLADIEWNTNKSGNSVPTQLAAIRLDEKWNEIDRFFSRIYPPDSSYYNWGHVSFRGGKIKEFLGAPNVNEVLIQFADWLNNEDVLVWWTEESSEKLREFSSLHLGYYFPNENIGIKYHVCESIEGKRHLRGSCYEIASSCGINVRKKLQHCAENDVRVMHELIQKLELSQERLLRTRQYSKPVFRIVNPVSSVIDAEFMCYYHQPTNTVHFRSCDNLPCNIDDMVSYTNPEVLLKKEYKLCSCCRSELRKARAFHNINRITRSQYNYIFTSSSNVYHRSDCRTILASKDICGVRYLLSIPYDRIPCKICRPDHEKNTYAQEESVFDGQASVLKQRKSGKTAKALKRQQNALQKRAKLLADKTLTFQQRADICVLTNPDYAFFSAREGSKFHLSDCSKLKNLTKLCGFSKYSQAVGAGLRPCSRCHPSSKQDVMLSIPITSRHHHNEHIEELEPLCMEAGYPFSFDSQYFCLETPVGKWRINTSTFPIKLKHINLVRSSDAVDYHDQPRLFLSFVDAFHYIRRHDEELMRKESQL